VYAADRAVRDKRTSVDKSAAAETESDVHDDAAQEASVKNDISSVTSWCAAVAAVQCTIDARRSTHSGGRERGSSGRPADVARSASSQSSRSTAEYRLRIDND